MLTTHRLLILTAAFTTLACAATASERALGVTYDPCPEGVPSAVAPNYLAEGPDAPAEEFCVEFQIRSDGPGSEAGYLPASAVPEMCGIHTYGRVIRLLKVISQCGVVLYGSGGWESPGVLLGGPGGVAVKAEVFRLDMLAGRPAGGWSRDPARVRRFMRSSERSREIAKARQ